MMRAVLHRLVGLAVLASVCGACIDTRLSLGHHSAAVEPDSDAFVPDMDPPDAMEPNMMGGQGGAPPMDMPDAGDMFDAAQPLDLCAGATLTAELQCTLDDGFMGQPGGRPPDPMATTTTLTLTPQSGRPGFADAAAVLAFDAWNASFMGRIEGQLDCRHGGLFSALIVDGQVTGQGMPPGPFFGQLDGMINPLGDGLDGLWWHGPDPQNGPRCSGTWTAVRN